MRLGNDPCGLNQVLLNGLGQADQWLVKPLRGRLFRGCCGPRWTGAGLIVGPYRVQKRSSNKTAQAGAYEITTIHQDRPFHSLGSCPPNPRQGHKIGPDKCI